MVGDGAVGIDSLMVVSYKLTIESIHRLPAICKATWGWPILREGQDWVVDDGARLAVDIIMVQRFS